MRNQVLVYAMIGMMALVCNDAIRNTEVHKMHTSQTNQQETNDMESSLKSEFIEQHDVQVKDNEEYSIADEGVGENLTEQRSDEKIQKDDTVIQNTNASEEKSTDETVKKVSLPMKTENITEAKLVGKEKVANDKDTIKSLVSLLESVDVKEANTDDYQTIYGFTALEFKDKSGNKMTVSLQGEYISVDDKVYAIDETEDELSNIYDEIYGFFNLERR